MSNKAPTLRKFKGFDDDHFASIGNYGQDCKTGQLLAFNFYQLISDDEEPQTSKRTVLKKVLGRIPKGVHYDGLIMGLFTQLSTYIEPLVKGDSDYEQDDTKDDLISLLEECSQYQDQLKTHIRLLVRQWLFNFTIAVNRHNYDGLERHLLSNLVLALPENLHLTKNCYACFCYELSLILIMLIDAKEVQA